ncbi:copper chaperone PCu(A)C [Herbaspirillum sp. GCM10030257]|uniref:copper chaperone PCu(A)C n=1 Tax=Herbaspirillum sp. GCM10030257 TaxID=3273393 RepID=UPI00361E2BB0
MKLYHLAAIAITAVASSLSQAHEFKLKDLKIGHPYARTTAPYQPSGAAYLSLENKGSSADRLTSISSPVAKSAEIHTMSMEGNVMKMREVDGIDLPPAAKVEMKPGHGYHIMLMGLEKPLKAGDKFPLTLTFEKAGKTDVTVVVEEAKKEASPAAGQHRH